MLNRLHNNVLLCHLDDSENKKHFGYQLYPLNREILNSNSFTLDNQITKYDDKVYKRGELIKHTFEPNKFKTYSDVYNSNIQLETELQHHTKLNKCDKKPYIPNTNSVMYKLQIPYKKKPLPHELLFEHPKFSNSDAPLSQDILSFNNHTREQRNLF